MNGIHHDLVYADNNLLRKNVSVFHALL